MRSLTNVISLFRIHGPRVRISSSTMRGPTRVEISVVNHGDCWNQDSNHSCWASRSLFRWASPFLTLAIYFLLPLSDLHKNNVFPLTQHIGPVREFILKYFLGIGAEVSFFCNFFLLCIGIGLPSRAEVSLPDLSWDFSHLKPAFTLVVAAI